MQKQRANISQKYNFVIILLLFCITILPGCGDSGSSGGAAANPDQVETGKIIQSSAWQAELLKAPEQTQVVGEGNITYQSETGVYLVVFLKITNLSGAQQVVPRDLFKVIDAQGQEFKATKSAIQVAYVLQKGMQPLLDSPLAANAVRESVVVFEVPTDATGLKLSMKEANETLGLGF